jgi:outer membrane protein
MNKTILNNVMGMVLASGMLLGTGNACAWQAGDLLLRAGAAGVMPTGNSDDLGGGAQVEADDSWSLGLTMTYMATNNIGVGVLAAWPFSHDIKGTGALAGSGTVAKTDQLPPTVTAQYHFDTGSALHPYVGAGLNYTTFFNTDTKGVLAGNKLTLDDSWGLALEGGMDYDLGNDWLVSGQVWYLNIDSKAHINGGSGVDVAIDPWVVMIGVGKKF